jgi:hypothetical protein
MNYIAKLKAENAAAEAHIKALELEIADLRTYLLTSPKFGNQPPLDSDGLPIAVAAPTERLDWIATSEVLNRLTAIVAIGREAADEAANPPAEVAAFPSSTRAA